MKKIISILTVMVLTIGMIAQPTPQKGKRHGKEKGNKVMKYFKDSLNVNADQEAKLKALLKDAHKQRKAIKQSTATKEEKKVQFKAIRASTDTKVKAILTTEQYTKMVATKNRLKANKKAKRKEHRKTPEGRATSMTKRMKKHLSLTEAQVPKVNEANLILVTKLKGLKADKKAGKDKKGLKAQGKEAHATHYSSIKTILTADQLVKYDKIIAERKAERKEKKANKKANKNK